MIRVKEKVQNSREFYLSIRFFLLSNIFVSFFFHFLFATDIDLRGRPMGFIPINAAIRDIRIDYNNTLPEPKRYFYFKLRSRARKIVERVSLE